LHESGVDEPSSLLLSIPLTLNPTSRIGCPFASTMRPASAVSAPVMGRAGLVGRCVGDDVHAAATSNATVHASTISLAGERVASPVRLIGWKLPPRTRS
jgi:hypothetical protein